MAENSWNFYKANLHDIAQGTQGTHSSLSSPLDSEIGGLYFRDFSSNDGPIKAVLTGSNFVGLDGTKAVSMTARVRVESEVLYNHFVFLAKTDTANPNTAGSSTIGATKGYKIGIGDASNSSNSIRGIYNITETTTSVYLFNSESMFSTSTWHLIRADIIPVYSGSSISKDRIKLFQSTDDGQTWTQIGETLEVSIGINNNWDNATKKYYGFQTWGYFVDNFEIYLSNSV